MRVGFRLLLLGVIVLGLGLGAGVSAYQASQPSASGAAAGAPVASTAQNAARQPVTQAGAEQSAQQRGGALAAGTVASVGENEFSLRSESGAAPVVVRLDGQTVVRKQVAGALSDVKPGERISVRGEATADGTITAAAVQLVGAEGGMGMAPPGAQRQAGGQPWFSDAPTRAQGQPRGQRPQAGALPGAGPQDRPGALIGTVKEVAGNVVTVARSGASEAGETLVKVSLSDQTTVSKTVAGDVKDIAEGVYVTAMGIRGADGTITAASVQILPPEAAGAMGRQQ